MARFPSAIQCVGVLVAVMLMSDAVNAEVTTCKVCANCGTSSTGTSTSCSTGGTSNYYCFKTVTNAFDAFIVINRGCTASCTPVNGVFSSAYCCDTDDCNSSVSVTASSALVVGVAAAVFAKLHL